MSPLGIFEVLALGVQAVFEALEAFGAFSLAALGLAALGLVVLAGALFRNQIGYD
ncbi:MAG: hypothetical protein LBS60_12655 [Deltaproteobacteria bacterium]|nr:hypothetical protein [Deltaproteobacteria bacterium]